MVMKCPNCSHPLEDGATECRNCGVIVAKWHPHPLVGPAKLGEGGALDSVFPWWIHLAALMVGVLCFWAASTDVRVDGHRYGFGSLVFMTLLGPGLIYLLALKANWRFSKRRSWATSPPAASRVLSAHAKPWVVREQDYAGLIRLAIAAVSFVLVVAYAYAQTTNGGAPSFLGTLEHMTRRSTSWEMGAAFLLLLLLQRFMEKEFWVCLLLGLFAIGWSTLR